MGNYQKLIAAAVGFVAILLKDHLGFDLPDGWAENTVNGIIAVGSLFWVYQGANKS